MMGRENFNICLILHGSSTHPATLVLDTSLALNKYLQSE